MSMKLAACQEMFVGYSWEQQFSFLQKAGYQGVEVSPFTLEKPVRDYTAGDRQNLKQIAQKHEIEIIGLHWLLVKTEGFYLTHNDPEVQKRTADYFCDLAQLCADLGGKILVLGSPKQRSILPGLTKDDAEKNARDTLTRILPTLEKTGTYLCLEPLGRSETDFWNTCQDCVNVINDLGSSHLRLHQDIKAMLDEPTPIPDLIRKFQKETYHFHVNDKNLLGPGMGDTDFYPILKALKETGYLDRGWLSLEVFDYTPGSEHIANVSRDYLLKELAKLESQG